MKVIPKLSTFNNAQIAETGQMVYANNVRINKIGNICRDYPITKIASLEDIANSCLTNYKQSSASYKARFGSFDESTIKTIVTNLRGIQTIIPYNKELYIFYYGIMNCPLINYNPDKTTNKFKLLPVNIQHVSYNIKGLITLNNTGDRILTLCDNNLSHINLTKCTYSDHYSLYTQNPIIPIKNLLFMGKYANTIPNGVYEFFIRYEINKDRYTNWFPCSTRVYAGTKTIVDKSLVGSIRYVDINRDSGESFIFHVEHLYSPSDVDYKKFQLGFILNHDDDTIARAWKKFPINANEIYFSYEENDIEEVELEEMLSPIYNITNVGNITSFKNKLYISNYNETNFNPDLQSYADKVEIAIGTTNSSKTENSLLDNTNPVVVQSLNEDNNISTQASSETLKIGYYTDGVTNVVKTINGNTIPYYINAIFEKIKSGQWKLNTAVGATNYFYYPNSGITVSVEVIEDDYYYPELKETYQLYHENYTEKTYDSESFVSNLSQSKIFNCCYAKEGSWIYNYDESGADDGVTGYNGVPAADDVTPSAILFEYCVNAETTDGVTRYISQKIKITYGFTLKGKAVKPGSTDDSGGDTGGGDTGGGGNNPTIPDYTPDLIQTFTDLSTMIPNQYYKFYIHYISSTGEITNGYNIGKGKAYGISSSSSGVSDHCIIYPKFTNIQLPYNYVACFFSIQHYRNKCYEYFANKVDEANGENSGQCYGFDCIELDTRLLVVDNIKLTGDEIVKYHPSFDSSNLALYGMSGKLGAGKADESRHGFFTLPYSNNTENPDLIKCTPFITTDSYNNPNYLDLTGFICDVCKPDIKLTEFADGGELYTKIVSTGTLNVNTKSRTTNEAIKIFPLRSTKVFTIYSNYNLNYLALANGITIKQAIKTYKDNTSYLVRYLNSNELSDVYQLPSMYNNPLGKTYNVYNSTNNVYRFDNTIRSSKLIGDEERIYVYNFNATDYYNVPTNKGIITNLVAVGDSILVHTESSLFKFTGTNSLMSSGGEDVQTKESDVFDTGITEIFGSVNGFGGLQNNQYSCVTYNGYFWFDSDSKRIYAYGGNGQLAIISDQIDNIINKADAVLFADDFYNDRIFIATSNNSGTERYTISYNTRVKAFVSYHDFAFTNNYSTKNNCYFTNLSNIYTISDFPDYGVYKNELYVKLNSTAYETTNATNKNASVIDIICKEDYESIKELQSIDWTCHARSVTDKSLLDFYKNTIFNYFAYGGDKIKIYSNCTHTDTIDIPNLAQSSNNRNDITDRNYYQYPYCYKDKWCWNYFSSVKLNDDFKYANKLPSNTHVVADNRTTLYGNYFVVRFIFEPVSYLNDNTNLDFEFENINFYTNKVL